MLQWMYYPKTNRMPLHLSKIISEFNKSYSEFNSEISKLVSDEVLGVMCEGLESIRFSVQKWKRKADKIRVPVSFGKMEMWI